MRAPRREIIVRAPGNGRPRARSIFGRYLDRKTWCLRVCVTAPWILGNYTFPGAHTRPLSSVIFLGVERERSREIDLAEKKPGRGLSPQPRAGSTNFRIVFMKWKKYRDTRKIRLMGLLIDERTKILLRDSDSQAFYYRGIGEISRKGRARIAGGERNCLCRERFFCFDSGYLSRLALFTAERRWNI